MHRLRAMGQVKAWGWMQVVLLVGAMAMTGAWLALLASVFGALSGVSPPPWSVQWLLIAGGVASARGLQVVWRGRRGTGAVFAVSAMIAAALTVATMRGHVWPDVDPHWLEQTLRTRRVPYEIRAPLVIGPLALALWGCGGWIGGNDLTGRAITQIFGRGALGLFIGLLAAAIVRTMGVIPAASITDSTIFFISAFVSLPLASLASEQRQTGRSDIPAVTLDSGWIFLLGGTILALIAVALLLASMVSPTILEPVVAISAYLVAAVAWVIHLLSNLFSTTSTPSPAWPGGGGDGRRRFIGRDLSPAAILWGIAIVSVVVAAFVLSRMTTRTGRTKAIQAYDEERASIWSGGETQAEWGHILTAIGARLRPRRGDDHQMPRTVRDAYHRFLKRGAAVGVPRAVTETPREYLERLQHIPAIPTDDAALLTAAYGRVRYGDDVLAPIDVTAILRAWERLDRELSRHQDAGVESARSLMG